jgi:hypothetical protein
MGGAGVGGAPAIVAVPVFFFPPSFFFFLGEKKKKKKKGRGRGCTSSPLLPVVALVVLFSQECNLKKFRGRDAPRRSTHRRSPTHHCRHLCRRAVGGGGGGVVSPADSIAVVVVWCRLRPPSSSSRWCGVARGPRGGGGGGGWLFVLTRYNVRLFPTCTT